MSKSLFYQQLRKQLQAQSHGKDAAEEFDPVYTNHICEDEYIHLALWICDILHKMHRTWVSAPFVN